MTKQEMADAVLRVVSNRSRNLRKALDRAKQWQDAADKGVQLNEEQLAVVNSVPRKEAMLAELKEIFRKLTVVTETHLKAEDDPSSGATNTTQKKNTKSKATGSGSGVENRAGHANHADDDSNNNKSDTYADDEGSPTTPSSSSQANSTSNKALTNMNEMTLTPSSAATKHDDENEQEQDLESEQINEQGNQNQLSAPTSPSTPQNVEQDSQQHSNHTTTDHTAATDKTKTNPASNDPDHGATNPTSSVTSTTAAAGSNTHNTVLSSSSVSDPSTLSPSSHSHSHDPLLLTNATMTKLVHDLEDKHGKQLADMKLGTVHSVLNLFHICDFLKQPGMRANVLMYFNGSFTDLELDLLCYFYVMLTSPNGYVAHQEAVDVSVAHCMEFLKCSPAEAFKGTSYARLNEIVTRISACPLLTERGKRSDTIGVFDQERGGVLV